MFWLDAMQERPDSIQMLARGLEETDRLSRTQILLGLLGSTALMIVSTWGVLSLLNFVQVYPVDPIKILPYTLYMLAGSVLSTIIAFILCIVVIRWPRIVNIPLRIHRYAKKGTGEYFLSPEFTDQTWSVVLRRSLYGSILVVGISLTILGFDMMVASTDFLFISGTYLMFISIIILPFTLLEFYYGPWLVKDSGLYHLDERDRSLSNVGDDLEDILEFFAGIDILFILLELTISVGGTAPWLPVFIILIPLGPLFSIVLNFTLVFMLFKNKATSSMLKFLNHDCEVPDMVSTPDYIRSRVLALIDRELLVKPSIEESDVLPLSEVNASVPIENDIELAIEDDD
ncbi:MAG: hypothetical protein ACFFCT_01415 [Candidatus Odinarchaeota archaeon]